MYKKSWEENGRQVFSKEYSLWNSMRQRVRNAANAKCYRDCSISDSFQDFQFFATWCNEQVGFLNQNPNGTYWHLDKDIVVPGNRTYSENTCVFIPASLNSFTTGGETDREMPRGVDFFKPQGKFRARCNDGTGVSALVGYFSTAEEASAAYMAYKQGVAKSLAIKLKGGVDDRVIRALNNYGTQGGNND